MAFSDKLSSAIDGIDKVRNASANLTNTDGFNSPPIPNGDGTGLPSSKIPNSRTAKVHRDIIHWFIPEFGVVKMYVNPSSIQYRDKKIIDRQRTKGGYTLQYWGEELTELAIAGTTGSSGIEGINVLHEAYRAEQLSFDNVGLALASDNAAAGAATQIVNGLGNAVGGLFGGATGSIIGGGIARGIFGADNFTALAPRNIASLASLAFGVEMFYSGKIYRGYFQDMTVNERADNMGLFEYTINFIATQIRGYRFNQYAHNRSAIDGPSNNDSAGGIPASYSKLG